VPDGALLALLNKSEQGADPNFLRGGVRLLAQESHARSLPGLLIRPIKEVRVIS
jgi:hypothetical protein